MNFTLVASKLVREGGHHLLFQGCDVIDNHINNVLYLKGGMTDLSRFCVAERTDVISLN